MDRIREEGSRNGATGAEEENKDVRQKSRLRVRSHI